MLLFTENLSSLWPNNSVWSVSGVWQLNAVSRAALGPRNKGHTRKKMIAILIKVTTITFRGVNNVQYLNRSPLRLLQFILSLDMMILNFRFPIRFKGFKAGVSFSS